MPSVGELKQAVQSVSQEAEKISETLRSFSEKNRDIMRDIASTLKGTEQSVDRDVASALEEANSRISAARRALEDAATSAMKYAKNL